MHAAKAAVIALQGVPLLAGAAEVDAGRSALAEAARILERKLLPPEPPSKAPLVLAVAGGTKVGKTTVLVALLGAEIGRPSPIAGATKAPSAYVFDRDAALLADGTLLAGWPRVELQDPIAPEEPREPVVLFVSKHERPELEGLVIVDGPDVDSTRAENRRTARDLLYAADAVLFVASPEKYNNLDCVTHLTSALRMRREVICVLNKCDADEHAETLGHFRSVVDAAAAGAGAPPPASYDLPPALARERAETLKRVGAMLRETILSLANRREPIRRAARAGSAIEAGRVAEEGLALAERQVAALARHEALLRGAADDAGASYRAHLDALEVYEVERVFAELARRLRVPVLDDVYDGVGAFFAPLTAKLGDWMGIEPAESRRRSRLREREEADRRALERSLDSALTAAERAWEAADGLVREPLRAALPPAERREALRRVDESYLGELRAAADAWTDETVRDLEARIEASPAAAAVLRGLKGGLRVGLTALVAWATGGLGPHDLAVAAVLDPVLKRLTELGVGRAYFDHRCTELKDRRAERARALLRARVEETALEALPPRPNIASIEAARAALAALARETGGPTP